MYYPLSEAVVTRADGIAADISDILPTPALQGRIDYDEFDGVITDDKPLEHGSFNWREMKVEGMSSCGRSAGKRPRLLNLSTVTVTATKTEFVTSTLIKPTASFDVMIACTTAGFDFGVPKCPPVVVTTPTTPAPTTPAGR